jgi:hypothetical protein
MDHKVLQDLIFVKLYYSAISRIVKLLYGYFPLSIMLIFTKVYQVGIITSYITSSQHIHHGNFS